MKKSDVSVKRLRLVVRGAVQGVGFRPFVYRLAKRFGLTGWVINATDGVYIEVEGREDILKDFERAIVEEKPPVSFIQAIERSWLERVGYTEFTIRKSEEEGEKTVLILPDIATCKDCMVEVFDPKDRRYRYPFTNCTNCGPRFTIIESLPYDRPNTTMKIFKMCEACSREYEDPSDRRFHAQPNACPVCGPQVELWDHGGRVKKIGDDAMREAVKLLKDGKILAVKGLGGFHVMVDPFSVKSVELLRKRKPRKEKPYALMFPDLETVKKHCYVTEREEEELTSPVAPILLLRKREESNIPDIVAPGNPYLGVMLPYTPLHHILLKDLGKPVIATSGNLSDEPIITDEREAIQRLKNVVDLFLVHTRPIKRHADDSIERVLGNRTVILRRARGLAPFPIRVKMSLQRVLAFGGHLKNTFALGIGENVFISQHIGDLETRESLKVFLREIEDFRRLFDFDPEVLACDMHPRYLSSQIAQEMAEREGIPLVKVQHHHAHLVSCMVENDVEEAILGITWDGTGYGLDGTVWGGEFLFGDFSEFKRVAHFRTFPLLGGDKAIKEPRRVALGLLFEIYQDGVFEEFPSLKEHFTEEERRVFLNALKAKVNTPLTSSVGRMFDAVASILGVRQRITFEGQAAMELEFRAMRTDGGPIFPYELKGKEPVVIDWWPLIHALIEERKKGTPVELLARGFHRTLAHIIKDVALSLGSKRVALTGGVFQNVVLIKETEDLLLREGIQVITHQRVPPNDGGISLGQAVVAGVKMKQMD